MFQTSLEEPYDVQREYADFLEHETKQCVECKELVSVDNIIRCPACGDSVCGECWDWHIETNAYCREVVDD